MDSNEQNYSIQTLHGKYSCFKVGDGAFGCFPLRYKNVKKVGNGTQGLVFKAYDEVSKQEVAIKKVITPLESPFHAKRTYREFKILNLVNHINLISVINAYTPQQSISEFQDVYLVTEYMSCTLEDAIYGLNDRLSQKLISFITYQILCGLKYLHHAGVIHRDLKPQNIVINNTGCNLKIIDYGLSRNYDDINQMSIYVMTRYYRAPEIILGMDYDYKSDLWSLGCIFVEMITRYVCFRGSNRLDQWFKIIQLIGTPGADFINRLGKTTKEYVQSMNVCKGYPLEQRLPNLCFPPDEDDLNAELARKLVSNLLVIDPDHRYTAEQALKENYVNIWYTSDEVDVVPLEKYDSTVELNMNLEVDEWKVLMYNELKEYEAKHDVFGTGSNSNDQNTS